MCEINNSNQKVVIVRGWELGGRDESLAEIGGIRPNFIARSNLERWQNTRSTPHDTHVSGTAPPTAGRSARAPGAISLSQRGQRGADAEIDAEQQHCDQEPAAELLGLHAVAHSLADEHAGERG